MPEPLPRQEIWHLTGRRLGAYRFSYNTEGVVSLDELHADGWAPIAFSNMGGGQGPPGPPGAGGLQPTADIKTADYTATHTQLVYVDSNLGSFTITLPSAPPNGTKVGIMDVGESWETFPVLLAPGAGDTVQGDLDGLGCDDPSGLAIVQYAAEVDDWRLVDNGILVDTPGMVVSDVTEALLPASPSPAQIDDLAKIVGHYKPEWWGCKYDGVTNDSNAWQAAMHYAYTKGGGTVRGRDGAVSVAVGLWYRNNVTVDLNGGTLKLPPSATTGIFNFDDRSRAPDPTARYDFRWYIPNAGALYTGGFYQFAAGLIIEPGATSLTLNVAAEAANFTQGTHAILISGANVDSQYVAESVIVQSANAGTGVITLQWAAQKRHKSGGTYFGIAKRDAGWISGERFRLTNGLLDGGANERYNLAIEIIRANFDHLTFKGNARAPCHIRGTQCHIHDNIYYANNPTLQIQIFSVDQGATDNLIERCVFNINDDNAVIHNGEPHSGTVFRDCTFNFPVRTAGTAPIPGLNGMAGCRFEGCRFYNYPGDIARMVYDDDFVNSQWWENNEFYGQFCGALIYTSGGTVPDQSRGVLHFHKNVAIGYYDQARAASSNYSVIRQAKSLHMTHNLIRIVDPVDGKINRTDYASVDETTCFITDNDHLPDMKINKFLAKDAALGTVPPTLAVHASGTPYLSFGTGTDQRCYFTFTPRSIGGTIVLYARLRLLNPAAITGNVVFRLSVAVLVDGASVAPTPTDTDITVAAGTQDILVDNGKSLLAPLAGIQLPGVVRITLMRRDSSGADTLAGVLGVVQLDILEMPRYGF